MATSPTGVHNDQRTGHSRDIGGGGGGLQPSGPHSSSSGAGASGGGGRSGEDPGGGGSGYKAITAQNTAALATAVGGLSLTTTDSGRALSTGWSTALAAAQGAATVRKRANMRKQPNQNVRPARALFCMTLKNPVRKFCIQVAEYKYPLTNSLGWPYLNLSTYMLTINLKMTEKSLPRSYSES
ncbi:serine, glycine and glutamine-rich protein-like [Biomphalaria glabrata]|uniref:Serine, glycine and glutamine-rich protein-like n=1 Tax=Biomphalaria glabrata TaxID=6526 RepID=A0A9W3A8S4_BIOGL|nr:serine, glycine and glutamine-rich protein-like [Biomphalaria glabrata]